MYKDLKVNTIWSRPLLTSLASSSFFFPRCHALVSNLGSYSRYNFLVRSVERMRLHKNWKDRLKEIINGISYKVHKHQNMCKLLDDCNIYKIGVEILSHPHIKKDPWNICSLSSRVPKKEAVLISSEQLWKKKLKSGNIWCYIYRRLKHIGNVIIS